eukprot:SAG31_NODE_6675_length_1930_cov_2.353905_3_plen_132_part_00
MKETRHQAEWQITADMYKVLSDRDQHRRAAEREGVSLTRSQRQAYATTLKKAALEAMKKWVTHNVKKLRDAAKNGRKQEFYDHWKRVTVHALPVALALAHLVPPLARAFAGLIVETTMGSVEARPEARATL